MRYTAARTSLIEAVIVASETSGPSCPSGGRLRCSRRNSNASTPEAGLKPEIFSTVSPPKRVAANASVSARLGPSASHGIAESPKHRSRAISPMAMTCEVRTACRSASSFGCLRSRVPSGLSLMVLPSRWTSRTAARTAASSSSPAAAAAAGRPHSEASRTSLSCERIRARRRCKPYCSATATHAVSASWCFSASVPGRTAADVEPAPFVCRSILAPSVERLAPMTETETATGKSSSATQLGSRSSSSSSARNEFRATSRHDAMRCMMSALTSNRSAPRSTVRSSSGTAASFRCKSRSLQRSVDFFPGGAWASNIRAT